MPLTESEFQQNSITLEFLKQYPKALRDSNLSEAEFAKKVDWNATTLSLVKNGKRNIPLDVWERFQNIFKLENEMKSNTESTISLLEHYRKIIALYEDVQRTKDEVLKSNTALSQAVANLSKMRIDVDEIKTNLSKATKVQAGNQAVLVANHDVMLEAFEEIGKKTAGEYTKRADNLRHERLQNIAQVDTVDA